MAESHRLLGEKLFRNNESIFIHKSSSLPSFIEKITHTILSRSLT